MKKTILTQPNWAEIHATPFIYEENCWTTCGGFCCGSHHKDFDFKLLPLDGAAIIYFGEEYDWMQKEGLVPEGMHTREVNFDFGGPKSLRLVVVDCKLKGLCDGCMTKPLHCRIYPFIPIFGIGGQLTDIYPGSIFDLTFLRREGETPCTVWHRRRDECMRLWQTSSAIDCLRHPKLMFYFAAYKCLVDNYQEMLSKNTDLGMLNGAEFWSKWELLYLGKRLFDAPLIKESVFKIYTEFRQTYGEFLG